MILITTAECSKALHKFVTCSGTITCVRTCVYIIKYNNNLIKSLTGK